MKYRLINKPIKENYTKTLLQERGVEDVLTFLNPDFSFIQDPLGMDNMAAGAALLMSNIGPNKTILICADCDVDGYTSATIMYQYIKKLQPETEIKYFLHEGKQHGLEDLIVEIRNDDTDYDLIIMPDASSNDYEYHKELGERGIPVLVLDHHIVEEEIHENAVVINNQSSSNYRNKELTGAGVAWQFCRYVDQMTGHDYAMYFTDLAALGIIGDMGGLNEIENQAIIAYGLKHINNFFFNTLVEKQDYSMGSKVNPTTVAFYIVPMINAMIRVGTMPEKTRLFEAFLDGTKMVPSNKRGAKGTMELLAVESARECTNAKSRQDKKKEEIVGNLEIRIHKLGLLENKILFIRLGDDDDFPSVLNGLVAMQLAAKFQRPTIVARLNKEGFVRGSARGLNECALESFKDFLNETGLFEYTAGHDNAFGISIPNSKLEAFHSYANIALEDMDFSENSYDVSFVRHAADKDLTDLIFDIGSYEHIWGQKMSEPMLYIDDINLTASDIQVCGARKDTVRFEKFGVTYIQFHAKQLIEDLQKYPEVKVNLVGRAGINEWMGNKKPQIIIKDYEVFDNANGF